MEKQDAEIRLRQAADSSIGGAIKGWGGAAVALEPLQNVVRQKTGGCADCGAEQVFSRGRFCFACGAPSQASRLPLSSFQFDTSVSCRRFLDSLNASSKQAGVNLGELYELSLVDPWAPGPADSQSLASQLFAASLFPYLGFLYHLTKSGTAPKLTLFGFYFLLAFVAATIPAGIYAKVHYGTSLSNVDWLHGGAESLLTVTNLLIVLGLRKALRESQAKQKP